MDEKKKQKTAAEKFFQEQLLTSNVVRGFFPAFEIFSKQKEQVLHLVADSGLIIEKNDEFAPFVPVIPLSYVGLWGLASMLHVGDHRGRTELDPRKIIEDEESKAKELYYIYGVKFEKETIGKGLKDAEEIVRKKGRFLCTLAESVAFCASEYRLKENIVLVGGTKYESEEKIISIESVDCPPAINWRFAFTAMNIPENRGFVSCLGRG
jgi:hypothetical protein